MNYSIKNTDNKEINLEEIAEKLKDKELFPEANKRAKEYLKKANLKILDNGNDND